MSFNSEITDEMLANICGRVRSLAEQGHCPSEVVAVERYLNDQANNGSLTPSQTAAIKGKCEDFTNALDNEYDSIAVKRATQVAKQYQNLGSVALINKITEKTPFRIRFHFFNTESDESDRAQLLRGDDGKEWFIALPKHRQEKLINSNIDDEVEAEVAVENKDWLRWLTLHELSHLLVSTLDSGKGKDEDFANTLANMMLFEKMTRNENIRRAQMENGDSVLARICESDYRLLDDAGLCAVPRFF